MFKTDEKLSRQSAQATTGQNRQSRIAPIGTLRNMRILLVDDMPTNIILLRAILEHGGFSNILTADNGKRALKYINAHTDSGACGIDLILLDIIMPSADGFYVCRKMQSRQEWQQIPIIMITSENKWREETARASFDSGATDIMFKPVRSIELIPRVTSALSQKYERDVRLLKERSLQKQLDERRHVEERLNYLVRHDDLTGLYNRRWLEQAIEPGLACSNNSALLYICIDKFRQFIIAKGSDCGDKLLIDVAGKLKKVATAGTSLARIANDEFCLFLQGTSSEAATSLAKILLQACAEIQVDDFEECKPLTLSIGISIINNDNTCSSGDVINRAEQACYTAKQAGGNSILLSVD